MYDHRLWDVDKWIILGLFRSEGTSQSLCSNFQLKAGSAMKSVQITQGFIQAGLENSTRMETTKPFDDLMKQS